MMGKGLTEILTNQKYDQSDNGFFSQVMEPHDMGVSHFSLNLALSDILLLIAKLFLVEN